MSPGGEPSTLIVLAGNRRRGAELRGTALAAELRHRGVTADVLAIESVNDGSPTVDVETMNGRHTSPRTLRDLRARACGYDVVIAYGSTTLPACVAALAGRRRPKLVYRSIGRPRDWVRGGFHRARTAALFAQVDHTVALWDDAADDVHRLFKVSRRRISAIPSGYALDAWTSADRAVPPTLRLVVVGALSEEKRVDRAIDAVALLPEAELVIVGGGPLRSSLEAQVAAMPPHARDRIRFVGAVADVRPFVASSTAVLLTSRTEGLPGTVIEAALMGVPSFAADVGAVSSIIDDGVSGVVLPSAAPDVVAGLVREHASTIAAMGPAAEARARAMFGWDVVAPQWLDLLRRLAAD